ncbi:MAG: GAF domain-containing protein [Chloroflexi bacterium]|nr:ATP-binding protein [Chloroflexota bacterium]MQC26191.1 GAF domain-containing protein [Chloroflexota bacterium]
MKRSNKNTGALQLEELKAVYAISRVIVETLEFDKALAEIVRLSRPVFIFDNLILYLLNETNQVLEPAFARAIGRGRAVAEELAWGDLAAKEAFESGEIFLKEPAPDPDADRLDQGFYLGQPLTVGGKTLGALVFIRFGGPAYTDEQINLAEFIAAHVSQVLEHQRMVERIANLEAGRRLGELQSDFLATVSHELKTPLGFIKGYATTLLRQDADWNKAESREFLSVIDEETDHLGNLVNNLIDSSRLQSGILEMELQDVEMETLIGELLDRWQSHYPQIQIDVITPENETHVWADPIRLSQVMENLVSNAAKYAANSRVRIEVEEDNERVFIRVADSGPGIAAEHLDQVFKRFYRVPEPRETVRGSGLGLYICHQIIQAHEGRVDVVSKVGSGTTFTVQLPKQLAPQQAQEGQ